jgi:hypothetical protein
VLLVFGCKDDLPEPATPRAASAAPSASSSPVPESAAVLETASVVPSPLASDAVQPAPSASESVTAAPSALPPADPRKHTNNATGGPTTGPSSPIVVRGKITADDVERAIRTNYGRLRTCYELGLAKVPTLSGLVRTKFVVDASGSVISSEDAGSELPDVEVVSCIARAYRGILFAKPSDGRNATVTVPMVFQPGF